MAPKSDGTNTASMTMITTVSGLFRMRSMVSIMYRKYVQWVPFSMLSGRNFKNRHCRNSGGVRINC